MRKVGQTRKVKILTPKERGLVDEVEVLPEVLSEEAPLAPKDDNWQLPQRPPLENRYCVNCTIKDTCIITKRAMVVACCNRETGNAG